MHENNINVMAPEVTNGGICLTYICLKMFPSLSAILFSGSSPQTVLWLYQNGWLKHCSVDFFFTWLGEKKEVTDPGIRSCPPNVGVAQLCQVMDLQFYTQTFVPIGWLGSGSPHLIGHRGSSVCVWVSKRQEWKTTQHSRRETRQQLQLPSPTFHLLPAYSCLIKACRKEQWWAGM